MTLPDPYDCEAAELLGRHFGINFILFIHLFLSLIAIALIFYIGGVSTALRRFFALIHKNLRIIFFFGIATFLAHSFLIVVLRAQSLISAMRPSLSKCDFQWNTLNCLVLKVPVYWCVMSFSIFHFAVFVERAMATFIRNYSQFGYRFGILILFLMVFINTCVVYYVYRNEDLNIPRAYCVSTTPKSAPQLQLLIIFASIIDFLAIVGDFLVYQTNKRLKEVPSTMEYTLAKKFQIRENELSLSLILPLSAIHSCFFVTYLVASITLRSLIVDFNSVNHIMVSELLQTAVCLYVCILVLSFLFLWLRVNRRKPDWIVHPAQNQTDVYFEQLRAQMKEAHLRTRNVQESGSSTSISRIFSCCKSRTENVV